jgi:hypothetical protein
MQHRLHAHRLPVVARPANVVACRPLVASSPYLPLLWPVTMALVGAFFWGMWGDGRPKSPLAGAPETPATPTALAVLADVVAPADPRKRLEIADVFAAYAAACKARGRSCQRRCVRCASEGIQRCGRHSHTIERRQTLLVRCEVGGMKKASPLGDCPLRTLISL